MRIGDVLFEKGWLGQKTGKGHFDYRGRAASANQGLEPIILKEADKLGIAHRQISNIEIIERCFYSLVNEGAMILEEGIVSRASDLDVIWCFGYGFPAWRGGQCVGRTASV